MRDLRQMAVSTTLRLWSAALLVAVMLIVPGAARAAGCSPTTAAELAAAIRDANAGNCPNNTITLTQGATYTFATPNFTGDSFWGDAALPNISGTVVIEGNGAIIERSSATDTPRFRLLVVYPGNLTLRNVTLRNGAAQNGGANLPFGGCIIAYSALTLQTSTLTNCTIGSAGNGAAISTNNMALVLDRSTLYGNSGGPDIEVHGGSGIIRNSTMSGNNAIYGAFLGDATLTLVNSTVTGYQIGLSARNSTFNLKNSIVAGNSINVYSFGSVTTNDQGNNILAGNPGLAPLADNGGPTKTHALLPNSPAVNAGDAATCADASGVNNKDQRGQPRTNDQCDIGAYELQPSATNLNIAAVTGTYGGTVNLSATLTQGGSPVPNQQVSFTLNGSPVGSATSNASGVATLSNVSLSGIGAGNYPGVVRASFAGKSPFQTSSGNASLTVNQADQTISFDTPAGNPTYSYPIDSTFTVGGSASSGLPVSFSVTSGPCSLSGISVTIIGAGTCVVQADQAGNTNYKAAPSVIRSFTITIVAETTMPVASPTQSPAANSAGWNTSDVTVSWNWADEVGGSGIDSANCTASSTSSGEGTLELTANCADLAGNPASANYTVKVDKTAPTTTGSFTSAGVQATVTLAAADALSGLARTVYSVDGGAVQPYNGPFVLQGAGAYTISFFSADIAGNTEVARTLSVNVAGPPPGQLIKAITFEGGSLTGATGADEVVGPVALETAAPIKGNYSARIPNRGDTYLVEQFTPADDLYVSFYIVLHQLPSEDVRIPLISNAGTTITSIFLRADGSLELRERGNKVNGTSAPLALNTIYRIGIHQKRGAGGNAVVEGWLAVGDAPFGAPFAAKSNGTWMSRADRLKIGATISAALDATLDDIKLATGAMPQ